MTDWKPLEDSRAPFPSTRWSQILEVSSGDESVKDLALGELVWRYGHPLYAYARRSGHPRHDAQDFVQGFLAVAVGGDLFSRADPAKGRMRTYLLTCFRRYIHDRLDERNAAKRGGNAVHIPLDTPGLENSYASTASRDTTPEVLFDQRWANSLISRGITKLKEAYEVNDKAEEFDSLKGFLHAPGTAESYRPIAEGWDVSINAVEKKVSRLRRRLRDTLLQEIEIEVGSEVDPEEELQYLLTVLGSVGT